MRLLVALSANDVPIFAQSGGGYNLTWNTLDGGGGMFSTGGTYQLGGTISQPDAGMMSGRAYTLKGGFWGALANGASAIHDYFFPVHSKIEYDRRSQKESGG